MSQSTALTAEQISSLYRFCARHYVHYYDLQAELVDHLASAIEERMASQPRLSFDEALEEVYKGFGIKGFADVVAERERQLSRSNNRFRRELFFNYFRWPKLAFTLLLATVVYTLGKWFPVATVQWVGGICLLAIITGQAVVSSRIRRMARLQHKQLLLTQNISSGVIWSTLFAQIWVSRHIWDEPNTLSDLRLYALILLVTLSVVAIASYYEYCKALYTRARQLYPAAFATAA